MATKRSLGILGRLLATGILTTYLAFVPANRASSQNIDRIFPKERREGQEEQTIARCTPRITEDGQAIMYTLYLERDPISGRVLINAMRPTLSESVASQGGHYTLIFEDKDRNVICNYPFDLEGSEEMSLVVPRSLGAEMISIEKDNLISYRSHSLGQLLRAGFERQRYDLPSCTLSSLFPQGAPCRDVIREILDEAQRLHNRGNY